MDKDAFREQLLIRVNKCLGSIEELLLAYRQDRRKLAETFQVLETLTRLIEAEKDHAGSTMQIVPEVEIKKEENECLQNYRNHST